MKKGGAAFWIGGAVAIGLAGLAAFTIKNEYVFFAGYTVLMSIVLATAWNILGGYAGYEKLATAAFFGLGAYTSVVLIQSIGAPLVVQILAAAVMSGLLGFGTGLMTLRLRGIFFAIARSR
jgi:branched-chain amino acid transport system permease protein